MSMGKKSGREKAFRDIVKTVQQNTALYIIALNRHFGIGAKRLDTFLEFYEQLTLEFQEYDKDGVTQEKICAELNRIGIDPSRLFENIPSIQEFRPRKQEMSIAEMHRVLPDMKAMDLFKKDLGV